MVKEVKSNWGIKFHIPTNKSVGKRSSLVKEKNNANRLRNLSIAEFNDTMDIGLSFKLTKLAGYYPNEETISNSQDEETKENRRKNS